MNEAVATLEPVGRRARPVDRAEPERRVAEGRDGDDRDRPPRLPAGLSEVADMAGKPIALHAPAGGRQAVPRRASRARRWRSTRRRRRPAAASPAPRSTASRSSSTRRNCRSRSRRSGSARTRAARRPPARRSSTVRTRASSPSSCSSTPPTPWTARSSSRVEQLFHCCVPTDDSLAKKKASPPLVVLQWGEVKSFAGFVTSVQAKYTLFTAAGHADPRHLQRVDRGDARQPAQAEPDVRRPRADLGAHGRRGRLARLDRLPRVRRPDDVAPARRVQRHRRPAAAAAGRDRCCCPPSTTSWPGCDVAQAQISNAFTISIDGTPLPADLEPLLVSADVDDSLNLPDLVILRFRDAERTVLAKTNIKIGAKLVVAATSKASTSPEPLITAEVTALEAEFDATGTFTVVRGYDPAHRLFRGRRTETYTQVTASDVAKKVAQRAGLTLGTVDADVDGLRPRQPGRGLRLGVHRRAGPRDRARGGGQGRQVRVPRAEAGEGRARTEERAGRAAAPAPGHRPRALPVGRHLGGAGQGGAGPGLGRRAQAGARRHRAGEDPVRGAVRLRRRPDRPGQDVRRPGVRRHGRALPRAVRGRRRREGAVGADRGRVRRVRGHRPRQPQDPRGHRDRDRQPRRAVRRQVRGHLLAARLRPVHRLHHALRRHRPPGAVAVRARLRLRARGGR